MIISNRLIFFIFIFQKAFDSVPHKRLLDKLKAYGITGKTHAIVKDFLSERGFKVRVGSTYSRYSKVSSGVPQGTVLALHYIYKRLAR